MNNILKNVNLNKIKSNDIEIEIKLGKYYSGKQFSADVNEIVFYKLLNNFISNKFEKKYKNSIVCIKDNIREELFLKKNNSINSIEKIKKHKLKTLDYPNDNYRISISKEEKINNSKEEKINNSKEEKINNSNNRCFRYKKRLSIINEPWRFDFTEVYDTENNLNLNSFIKNIVKNQKLKPRYEVEIEYIGDIANFNKINIKDFLKEFTPILNFKYEILNNIFYILKNNEFNNIKSKNIKTINSKDIMTQVQNLNSVTLNSLNDYAVTHKADGERLLLYIQDNNIFLIDNTLDLLFVKNNLKHNNLKNNNLKNNNLKNNNLKNNNLKINKLSSIKLDFISDDLSSNIYLFDLEFVNNKYMIFDCIIFDNIDISSLSLIDRLNHIKKINFKNNFVIKEHFYIDKNNNNNQNNKNNNKNNNSIWDLCKKVYIDTKYDYHIDGLIFTPKHEQYRTNVYKWKPVEEQTIDFFIIIKKKEDNHLILDLYVSAHKKMGQKYNKSIFKNLQNSKFLPYLFIKNNKILIKKNNKEEFIFFNEFSKDNIIIKNKSIIEMNYINNIWCPYRIRTDKEKNFKENIKKGIFIGPNGLYTAKGIVTSIKKPITIEMLTTGQIYFMGINRNNAYINPMLNFNNFVKKHLFDTYLKKDMSLLELAAGRGGDLYKFLSKSPKYVLFTDFAKDAINEAKRRYKTMHNFQNINMDFIELDLTKNSQKEINNIVKNKKFDVISCQFAIHYFMDTFEIFFNNMNKYLKKNGIFIFTCFNSSEITKLLNKNNTVYFPIKNRRNNKSPLQISKIDNKNINVYVETIGKHPEPLADLDFIIKYYEDNGYELIENKSFQTLYKDYKKDKLSNSELKFTSLYNFVVLKKIT